MYDLNEPLTAFSLTHVQYDPQDPMGIVMAVASLLPILLLVSYLTLVASRRDLATIYILIGQLGTEVLNYILKHTIKEARPKRHLHGGYGMPSSHAQFMLYWASILTLWITYRLKVHTKIYKLLSIVAINVAALIVCYSRVHLSYHTPKQVIVGASVGVFSGTVWYLIVTNILIPFKVINVDWKLMKYFYVRDTTDVPYIMDFEYKATSNAHKKRK